MSKFKGNRRIDYDGKDQYFTKRSVAQGYIEITNKLFPFKDYDLILEPSAGEGAFLDYLPKGKSLGVDIDPQRKDVVEQDFFEYSTNKKTLTIGNPPFGIRNKLSVRFFNHAANFSDTIAFIIPNPWKMYSIHKRLDNRFKLVYEEQLQPFSFQKQGKSPGKRHLEDNSTNVNCVFQIWTKEETDLPDLRKYEKDPKSHPDFTTYGYFADKKIGYRWAVLIGALLMSLGHGAMALETPFFIYTGLTLLVFGSGFFKPNMTSIISEMYKDRPEKKDGAYTLFYMGVNAGAFFGILLCGYLGEKVGWSVGFGLAGIFMLFGLIQFWLSQSIFGDIGLKPSTKKKELIKTPNEDNSNPNPFPKWQLALITITTILGLSWLVFEPVALISEGAVNIFDFEIFGMQGNNATILFALVLFLSLLVYRIQCYDPITKEKMIAVSFFAFLTIFFWAIFEQAPGTLTIFARDYTDRVLEGNASIVFLTVDALMKKNPGGNATNFDDFSIYFPISI